MRGVGLGRGRGPEGSATTKAGNVAGFTLVGLLLVVVVISILAALARPALRGARMESRIETIVGDLEAVGQAARLYQATYDEWPAEVGRGRIPAGMEEFLPEGFTFRKPEYQLDYEGWAGWPRAPFQAGVSVITDDAAVGTGVLQAIGSGIWSDGRSKYTWVIQG